MIVNYKSTFAQFWQNLEGISQKIMLLWCPQDRKSEMPSGPLHLALINFSLGQFVPGTCLWVWGSMESTWLQRMCRSLEDCASPTEIPWRTQNAINDICTTQHRARFGNPGYCLGHKPPFHRPNDLLDGLSVHQWCSRCQVSDSPAKTGEHFTKAQWKIRFFGFDLAVKSIQLDLRCPNFFSEIPQMGCTKNCLLFSRIKYVFISIAAMPTRTWIVSTVVDVFVYLTSVLIHYINLYLTVFWIPVSRLE